MIFFYYLQPMIYIAVVIYVIILAFKKFSKTQFLVKEGVMIGCDTICGLILAFCARDGDHSGDFLLWPFFAVCIITNAVIWFMLLFRHDYVKTIIRERDYFRIVLMAVNTFAVYCILKFIWIGIMKELHLTRKL